MLEVIWTRRAEDHIQRIFDRLDAYSPRIARGWLDELEEHEARIAEFPESPSIWRKTIYRCARLRRGLGLFYSIEGRRIIVAGIFPLSMDPASILRRLENDEWT